jgi:hypothetical protein
MAGWAEVVGRLPATLLTWMAVIACAAFVALVSLILVSIYITKQPFEIATYKFGPIVPSFAPIPDGAVIAFDNLQQPDNCPTGWEPSIITRGRIIVADGDPLVETNKYRKDERNKNLKNFASGQHGGDLAMINFTDRSTDDITTPSENMLPWIALTFCRKKAEEAGQ